MAEHDDVPIAARDAAPGVPTASPWGPDDELGMLNLITPESRARILAEADATRMFDLSVDFFPGMPSWTATGDQSYGIWPSHTPSGQMRLDFR